MCVHLGVNVYVGWCGISHHILHSAVCVRSSIEGSCQRESGRLESENRAKLREKVSSSFFTAYYRVANLYVCPFGFGSVESALQLLKMTHRVETSK